MSSGALVRSLSFKLAASSFLTMYLHSFQNNQFGLLSPFISVVPEGKNSVVVYHIQCWCTPGLENCTRRRDSDQRHLEFPKIMNMFGIYYPHLTNLWLSNIRLVVPCVLPLVREMCLVDEYHWLNLHHHGPIGNEHTKKIINFYYISIYCITIYRYITA